AFAACRPADKGGAGKTARERPHHADGRAEARYCARLCAARLCADQGKGRTGSLDFAAREAVGSFRPVFFPGYFFIRVIQGPKPASRSVRNLRVASSVIFPCASNLPCAEPMKTSGRGSTWAQS